MADMPLYICDYAIVDFEDKHNKCGRERPARAEALQARHEREARAHTSLLGSSVIDRGSPAAGSREMVA